MKTVASGFLLALALYTGIYPCKYSSIREGSVITTASMEETYSKMERGDRVTVVYHRLRELIVRGRLAPGARIIETVIAARLGVSRTPVRAALQRLQQEGYVVVASPGQQSRMAVAPLTQEDALE